MPAKEAVDVLDDCDATGLLRVPVGVLLAIDEVALGAGAGAGAGGAGAGAGGPGAGAGAGGAGAEAAREVPDNRAAIPALPPVLGRRTGADCAPST